MNRIEPQITENILINELHAMEPIDKEMPRVEETSYVIW